MAKSKAKKQRDKIVREGGRDPQKNQSFFTKSRDGYKFTSQKCGSTKKDKIFKQKYKQSYGLL